MAAIKKLSFKNYRKGIKERIKIDARKIKQKVAWEKLSNEMCIKKQQNGRTSLNDYE